LTLVKRDAAAGLAQTERELAAERAAALARIAGTLEDLLLRLDALRVTLEAGAVRPARRDALREEYGRLREQARLYRWYLRVQREAVGFFRHDGLDERYPIPDSLAD
jgi:hypothetical protein